MSCSHHHQQRRFNNNNSATVVCVFLHTQLLIYDMNISAVIYLFAYRKQFIYQATLIVSLIQLLPKIIFFICLSNKLCNSVDSFMLYFIFIFSSDSLLSDSTDKNH
jgi:hypothetical protein